MIACPIEREGMPMGTKTEIPVTEPSVQLTQSDLLRLEGYRWDMTGFVRKQEMSSASGSITQREAENVFQLDPAPAKPEDLSSFIIATKEERDLRYVSFFLHHYETAMNKQIRRFLLSNGMANQPERFLDMKLSCMEVILKKFQDYDPEKNAAFTTYLSKFLRDAMLACRMQEEAWSLSSLSVYKGVRLMAAVYAQSHENSEIALESFMQRTHCTPETAKQYLKMARGIRARENEFLVNEDGEETEDEILIDNSWHYSELIWDGIRSSAIQDAFWKLRHRDQQLLERRNAICMQCRRVGHPSQRQSYEQLSALIQASTDKGAEKAYNSSVKKFETKLIERSAVRLVKLKCISKTMGEEKIANATYWYQADCDGEWGDLYLDFEKRKGEIRKLADWDTTISHIYAYEAIRYLFRCFKDKLPEQATVPFDVG